MSEYRLSTGSVGADAEYRSVPRAIFLQLVVQSIVTMPRLSNERAITPNLSIFVGLRIRAPAAKRSKNTRLGRADSHLIALDKYRTRM